MICMHAQVAVRVSMLYVFFFECIIMFKLNVLIQFVVVIDQVL